MGTEDHFKKLLADDGDVLVLPQSHNAELYFEDDKVDKVERRLEKNNVDEESKKDVLAIAYSLKGQMVGK